MPSALVTRPRDGKNHLSLEEIPEPNLEKHQVLVKTKAIAQNPVDIQSFDPNAFGEGVILGCDFAGTVEKVGADVKRVKVGDEISAFTWGGEFKGIGGYATHSVADEKICFKTPSGVSVESASTIPLALNTAYLALFSTGCLNIDKTKGSANEVLIWGGSSSVGLYSLQLAKIFGLNVATVCSPHNFDLVRSMGARHVFDYHSDTVVEDIKKALPNLEYVFDTIGSTESSATGSKAVREKGGVLCTVRPDKQHTDKVESRVKVTAVLVFTAFLHDHDYKGTKWPASDEDHNLSAELYENIPEWLTSGRITPSKVKVLGGLDKVNEGFQLYRDQKISAEKIVYNP